MQQKKLKLIISSLKQKDLVQLFDVFTSHCMIDLTKNIKKISYSCYEANIDSDKYSFSAYGKNHNQAMHMVIINFFQKILTDDRYYSDIKYCIRKFMHNHDQNYSQKMKTLPDAYHQRKSNPYLKSKDDNKSKENIIRSTKTIKEQIFQTLNHVKIKTNDNSQTKSGVLSKNSSFSILTINNNLTNHSVSNKNGSNFNGNVSNATNKEEQMTLIEVNKRIKQLEQKLNVAMQQNEYLKKRLKDKQNKQEKPVGLNYIVIQDLQQKTKTQKSSQLKEISSNINQPTTSISKPTNIINKPTNNIKHPTQTITQQSHSDKKQRSYSLSTSINNSAFNSKITQKIKIPKLNLGVLPNYHGKSIKSLNQQLLQNYEKKYKISSYHH